MQKATKKPGWYARCLTSLLATACFALVAALPPAVSAQPELSHAQAGDAKPAEKKKKKKARALANASIRYVQRVLKVFDLQEDKEKRPEGLLPEDYQAALEILRDWQTGVKRLRSYDASVMWNYFAYVYQSLEDYPKAREAYLKVIAEEDATYQLATQALLAVAQIDFIAEDYQSAYEWLLRWYAEAENPSPNTVILLAQAAYQIKDYRQAIRWSDQAIDSFLAAEAQKAQEPPADGEAPYVAKTFAKENWYVIKMASLSSLKRDLEVIDILEFLVLAFPKKQYWVQLASYYGEVGKTEAQLATWEAALMAGFLTKEAEVLAVAQLNANYNSPYRGARVATYGLEQGIIETTERNVRVAADLWYAALEFDRASAMLEKHRSVAKDGAYLEKLGYVYVQSNATQKAIKTLREAVQKEGLRDKPIAALLVAQLHLDTQEYTKAVAEFDKWLKDFPPLPNLGKKNKKARDKRAATRKRARSLRNYAQREYEKLQEIARIAKQEIPFDAL